MNIKSLNLDNGIFVKKIISKMNASHRYEITFEPMLIFPKNHSYFMFGSFYPEEGLKIKRYGYDKDGTKYQGFERKLCEKYNDLFLKFNDGKYNFLH